MAQLTIDHEEILTGEELFDLGDIGPCELIDGRIVYMSPTGGEHARLEIRLGVELELFVRQRKSGWVLVGEVGIYTQRAPDRIRGADVAFISRERLPDGPGSGFLDVAPELVVEIMSPTDRWQDVRQKIEEYFAADVTWIWVVEPDNLTVLVYDSSTEARKFSEGEHILGEGVLEGFSLDVTELFAG